MKPDWPYIGWVLLSPLEFAIYKTRRILSRIVARAVCVAAGRDPKEPLR